MRSSRGDSKKGARAQRRAQAVEDSNETNDRCRESSSSSFEATENHEINSASKSPLFGRKPRQTSSLLRDTRLLDSPKHEVPGRREVCTTSPPSQSHITAKAARIKVEEEKKDSIDDRRSGLSEEAATSSSETRSALSHSNDKTLPKNDTTTAAATARKQLRKIQLQQREDKKQRLVLAPPAATDTNISLSAHQVMMREKRRVSLSTGGLRVMPRKCTTESSTLTKKSMIHGQQHTYPRSASRIELTKPTPAANLSSADFQGNSTPAEVVTSTGRNVHNKRKPDTTETVSLKSPPRCLEDGMHKESAHENMMRDKSTEREARARTSTPFAHEIMLREKNRNNNTLVRAPPRSMSTAARDLTTTSGHSRHSTSSDEDPKNVVMRAVRRKPLKRNSLGRTANSSLQQQQQSTNLPSRHNGTPTARVTVRTESDEEIKERLKQSLLQAYGSTQGSVRDRSASFASGDAVASLHADRETSRHDDDDDDDDDDDATTSTKKLERGTARAESDQEIKNRLKESLLKAYGAPRESVRARAASLESEDIGEGFRSCRADMHTPSLALANDPKRTPYSHATKTHSANFSDSPKGVNDGGGFGPNPKQTKSRSPAMSANSSSLREVSTSLNKSSASGPVIAIGIPTSPDASSSSEDDQNTKLSPCPKKGAIAIGVPVSPKDTEKKRPAVAVSIPEDTKASSSDPDAKLKESCKQQEQVPSCIGRLDSDLRKSSAHSNSSGKSPTVYEIMIREEEILKLKESDCGPTLARVPSGELDSDLMLEPSFSEPPRDGLATADAADEEEEMEAYVARPMVFPGAFAVIGIDGDSNGQFQHDGEVSVTTVENTENDDNRQLENGSDLEAPTSVLEATLAQEAVLALTVAVCDSEEELLDHQKAKVHLRTIQTGILLFLLAAAAMVAATALGGFSREKARTSVAPSVEGWIQIGTDLYGPTREPQILFGSAVALSGNGGHLVVGAPGTDSGVDLNVGEFHSFRRTEAANATNWETTGAAIPGLGPTELADTSLAISHDGNRIVVGYAQYEGGRVQVYVSTDIADDRENTDDSLAWSKNSSFISERLFSNSDSDENSWFGHSVDLSSNGTFLAIGAPRSTTGRGAQAGRVKLFQRDGDMRWSQLGEDITGEIADEFSGWSVAVADSAKLRVAIGAPLSNDFTGVVRVFDWDGVAWKQIGSSIAGKDVLERFGESLDLSSDGNILVVGARGTLYETPGYASVFRLESNDWVLRGDTIMGEEDGEGFGTAVAFSGDGSILAVGAPQNSEFGERSGRVQILRYDDESERWNPQGSSIFGMVGSEFGSSVSLSKDGRIVAGGAPAKAFDDNVDSAGCVRVYERDD